MLVSIVRSLNSFVRCSDSRGALSAPAVVEELERLLFAPDDVPDLHALEAVVWRGAPTASFPRDIEARLPNRLSWSLPTREALDLIRCFVPEGPPIVDVGAGSGLWMRVLQSRFSAYPYLVSGFDSNPRHAGVAEQTLSAWCRSNGLRETSGLLIVSWPQFPPGPEQTAFDGLLDGMRAEQFLLNIAQGSPFGSCACPIFTERFHAQFELCGFERMPRIHRRDPSRAYAWLFRTVRRC